MHAYYSSATSSADSFGRRLEDMMASVEAEVRHAVTYVDRVVIPEVRRESGGALRTIAGHLDRWADKLDPNGKRDL